MNAGNGIRICVAAGGGFAPNIFGTEPALSGSEG